MKWKTFEQELPFDGERILILTTGCGVSASEGFFIKRANVEQYYNSGLIPFTTKQQIKKHEIDIEMANAYGNTPSKLSDYYLIIPIFSDYEDTFYTIEECTYNNFKWIPFPEE